MPMMLSKRPYAILEVVRRRNNLEGAKGYAERPSHGHKASRRFYATASWRYRYRITDGRYQLCALKQYECKSLKGVTRSSSEGAQNSPEQYGQQPTWRLYSI